MKKFHLFYLAIFFIILGTSCNKNMRYIHDPDEYKENAKNEYTNSPPEYRLQPYDYLYVTIKTTNETVNDLFNTISTGRSNNNNNNASNFYFTGYMVTDSGYVEIPILGDFYVQGKTMKEVREMIDTRTYEILKDAVINVRLTSFNVTFIGEFNNTGTMTYFQENLTILEALASVGGVNDYGKRTKILVVRKEGNKYKTFRVDVTDRMLLESPDLYILPNDLLYAEPVRTKIWRRNISDYAVITSVLSTTISTITSIMFFTTFYKNNDN